MQAVSESALPMPVFEAFLCRLHDGPAQSAAALRVGLAVWRQAVEHGDLAQARAAQSMLYDELASLVDGLTELQEAGRRWMGAAGQPPSDRQRAERAAAAWEAHLALADGRSL
jgi:hypothetical protein